MEEQKQKEVSFLKEIGIWLLSVIIAAILIIAFASYGPYIYEMFNTQPRDYDAVAVMLLTYIHTFILLPPIIYIIIRIIFGRRHKERLKTSVIRILIGLIPMAIIDFFLFFGKFMII